MHLFLFQFQVFLFASLAAVVLAAISPSANGDSLPQPQQYQVGTRTDRRKKKWNLKTAPLVFPILGVGQKYLSELDRRLNSGVTQKRGGGGWRGKKKTILG